MANMMGGLDYQKLKAADLRPVELETIVDWYYPRLWSHCCSVITLDVLRDIRRLENERQSGPLGGNPLCTCLQSRLSDVIQDLIEARRAFHATGLILRILKSRADGEGLPSSLDKLSLKAEWEELTLDPSSPRGMFRYQVSGDDFMLASPGEAFDGGIPTSTSPSCGGGVPLQEIVFWPVTVPRP